MADVTIYTTTFCPYCMGAKSLLGAQDDDLVMLRRALYGGSRFLRLVAFHGGYPA